MSLISYNLGIPDGPNNPSTDQPNMKTNNDNIATFVAVDHYGFNVNKSGTHKQVTLTNESAPGLGSGTGVLYANLINGQSWPIWQNALGSTTLVTGPTTAAANGSVYLAGGIRLQWGTVTPITANVFTNQALTFPNNCFAVFAQPFGSAGGSIPSDHCTIEIRSGTVTNTNFQWILLTNSSQYTGFYFVAIGN